MRYIDFKVQSGLFIITVVLSALLSIYGLMIGQLLIGVWQMLSSILSVVFIRENKKFKLWHLALSIMLLTITYFMKGHPYAANDAVNLFGFFLPCWGLAGYYYWITWRWYHADNNRSKFLPNISF